MRAHLIGLASAVALATSLLAGGSQAAPQGTGGCFYVTNWQNWRAASPKVVYLRVNVRDVYRLDLSAGSDLLMDPDVRLDDRDPEGTGTVCSPLDLMLTVHENGVAGMSEPIIVKSITKLTPADVAAIPPKYRP